MRGIILLMSLSLSINLLGQDSTIKITKKEIGTYICAGYLQDRGGDGYYTYSELSGRLVKQNHLIGAFVGVANVGCEFNRYVYKDLEFFLGFNFTRWGKFNDAYSYTFSISPSFKHFSDYGKDKGGSGDEVWQRDWGNQVYASLNISDAKNRPFRNCKLSLQYQTAFWSEREGTNIQEGFITDRVNVTAVNRSFFKTQLETAVRKVNFGDAAKIEPKLVFGYLWDIGSSKSMYETGAGFGISFTKEGRYYEAFNLQYRLRVDKAFMIKNHLDVIEVGLDPQNLVKLLF
ncbi:MAG: hypothetical protein ACM3PZ_03960 [Bacillota bacterium]